MKRLKKFAFLIFNMPEKQHWINRENSYIAREVDRTHEIYECREAKRVSKR